jgi:hypothetical protein
LNKEYVNEVEKLQKLMEKVDVEINHNIKPMFSDKKEN